MLYYLSTQRRADEKNALVAQLDRVFDYESKGRGFEPLQARQTKHRRNAWFQGFGGVFARAFGQPDGGEEAAAAYRREPTGHFFIFIQRE